LQLSEPVYRIAVLSMHTCPRGKTGSRDTGGMNVYIREISLQLGEMGHRVDIFTRDSGTAVKAVQPLGKNVRLVHIKAGPKKELPKEELNTYVERFSSEIEGFRRLHNLNYDLVFSNYWLSGLVGEYLQDWWEAAHVLMYHTLGEVKNRVCLKEQEPLIRLYSEKSLLEKCHLVLLPSWREKENFLEYFDPEAHHKVRVVPCGVDLESFRPMEKERAKKMLNLKASPLVLYVGRLEPVKGLERLIEALKYFPPQKRPSLIILGEGNENSTYSEELKEKCKELSLENYVHFRGRIEHENTPYYYNAADVTVVSSYYESFGMVVLEALSCGTPVVSTDVGDVRRIIKQGKTGFVLDKASAREMAQKLHLMISREEKLSPAAIRQTVASFHWQNISRALLREFNQAVKINEDMKGVSQD